ncbi:MAG: MoaD/ThiS family protein [Microbacteriaceae bacterium]|nr:MoaD/ThiS family protein [Microbacteriaceae bacterium]
MTAYPSTTVHLRFFAGARAATGRDAIDLTLGASGTLEEALGLLIPASDQPLDRVLARCSFLINSVATTDRQRVLHDGDRVDVMPPFAGG